MFKCFKVYVWLGLIIVLIVWFINGVLYNWIILFKISVFVFK